MLYLCTVFRIKQDNNKIIVTTKNKKRNDNKKN